ncbi:MAG: hypothetical protein K2X87_21030 [Gemmataceae bacterium]|nr:hypothetical protein [Gemmataceae bacterium]
MGGLALGFALVLTPGSAAQPGVTTTPVAERTTAKLLPVKVSGDFKDVPLREVLKEFAHQVDGEAGRPVMWTYAAAAGAKAGGKVSYSCKDKPLSKALTDVLDIAGLAFVVLSEDDRPRDGWVWVVPPDEAEAYRRFVQARGRAKGKPADARVLLKAVAAKYPGTKSAERAEALWKELAK